MDAYTARMLASFGASQDLQGPGSPGALAASTEWASQGEAPPKSEDWQGDYEERAGSVILPSRFCFVVSRGLITEDVCKHSLIV